MPTALRFNGLRAVIYPNDHRPAHVHVMGHGCEAVFNLHCPAGLPGQQTLEAAKLGQQGGKAKTAAKAAAARENGRLGGRPRKQERC
ncbi:DUF4160 domain-containing protein [Azotobacter chroococcum subsp. isscasi]|uniref:DUF4160 domain-containing protein n=1 Tax=Azotobacter chroococcum TaxID=353 RepID=UPI001038DE41|nr:DUF4160 domain-containing protein [Azotobacter chroococcum]TBW13276.1 DUF4160 domain-containing protein [Azotobacter chroococcum subsp. isscasi]